MGPINLNPSPLLKALRRAFFGLADPGVLMRGFRTITVTGFSVGFAGAFGLEPHQSQAAGGASSPSLSPPGRSSSSRQALSR
jgi:hypothetical protein